MTARWLGGLVQAQQVRYHWSWWAAVQNGLNDQGMGSNVVLVAELVVDSALKGHQQSSAEALDLVTGLDPLVSQADASGSGSASSCAGPVASCLCLSWQLGHLVRVWSIDSLVRIYHKYRTLSAQTSCS